MTSPASHPAPEAALSLPWWCVAYSILTTAALALLAWGLVLLQAIGYGVSHTLDLGPVDAPDADRYGAALAVAVAVNIGGSVALSQLWRRRGEPTLTPAVAAVPVVLAAGVTATVAMLAVLGIAPSDLLDLL
ncbi:hypothetical protein [Terrabacter sp. 2RAF25]|uniref:hypothetical protein n=1 Tax=Terrabacter sp. 2RAF25 TaxID=3232998 RepID=UPI003F9A6967